MRLSCCSSRRYPLFLLSTCYNFCCTMRFVATVRNAIVQRPERTSEGPRGAEVRVRRRHSRDWKGLRATTSAFKELRRLLCLQSYVPINWIDLYKCANRIARGVLSMRRSVSPKIPYTMDFCMLTAMKVENSYKFLCLNIIFV